MEDDVYRRLQKHLDRMPVPFPATESGIEIRILQQLFTPAEAKIALQLSALPEPLATIHKRLARDLSFDDLQQSLDRMAAKGSIRRIPTAAGESYGKAPLVIGMYEWQVDRLTPEFERDVRAYFDEKFGDALHSTRTPQLRVAPVNRAIPLERAVAPYDNIRKVVLNSPGPFAAMNCVCRQGRDLTGEPCRQTSARRNCLMFGSAAELMMEKQVATEVTREEMLQLLEQADREGLVLEPQNAQNPLFVCCCCGCCCGVLTTARKKARPADFFQTDFVAEVDEAACEVCGVCAQRCQMDAIAFPEGRAAIAQERCIGCGLCVTTCPAGAMRLRRKAGQKPPPPDTRALYSAMFQERFGRLRTAAAIAGHLVGRKI